MMPYVFLAPAIVLFVVFLLIPIGYAIYLSFQGLRLVGGGAFGKRAQTFVGLDNYQTALTDPEFVSSFGRLAIYGADRGPVHPRPRPALRPAARSPQDPQPSGSPAPQSSFPTRCPGSSRR